MTQRRRYQLTEEQLQPVIRFINENYPVGVTGNNIDSLSGADGDAYAEVTGVQFDPKDYDFIFNVETEQNQMLTKKVYAASDEVINKVNEELGKLGGNPKGEWEIQSAEIKQHHLVLNVAENGKLYPIAIHTDYVLSWLPALDSDEPQPTSEPDPDEFYDRQREKGL
jgi:hypothetical protein